MFNDQKTMDNGERGGAEEASHATQCFCDVWNFTEATEMSGRFLTTIL
jgi:hypothetical protein